MRFTIRSFIAKDGERFSRLHSTDDPWPLFYPAAFIDRTIRLATTHSTQIVYLDAIKRLLEWEAVNAIDLETRFQRLEFLRSNEIDGLVRYLNAARRKKSGQTISESKGNTYVSCVALYLKWLADELITDSYRTDVASMIKQQHERLIEKLVPKTGSKSAKKQRLLSVQLSADARAQLENLWDEPFYGLFRTTDRGSRLRSVVMLRVLYETGMRRGELLALKLRNFLESVGGVGGRLTIERNHHDEFDSRVLQPVAKTEGRTVPISSELESQLIEYITTYRADVPGVGFDDEDFIFVTHRSGPGQGQPLSISNCNQALRSIKLIFPALRTLHFHLLRHDWNYRFSKVADAMKMHPNKEMELRRVLMGWSSESDTPKIYNTRHVQEQVLDIGRQVVGATARPTPAEEDTLTRARSLSVVVSNTK